MYTFVGMFASTVTGPNGWGLHGGHMGAERSWDWGGPWMAESIVGDRLG